MQQPLNRDLTGLPMLVWVHAGDDEATLKVGTPMPFAYVVTVAFEPEVRVLTGSLYDNDLLVLRKWVDLNRQALVEHLAEKISYEELLRRVRKLDNDPTPLSRR
jgi:hypothetical protein